MSEHAAAAKRWQSTRPVQRVVSPALEVESAVFPQAAVQSRLARERLAELPLLEPEVRALREPVPPLPALQLSPEQRVELRMTA